MPALNTPTRTQRQAEATHLWRKVVESRDALAAQRRLPRGSDSWIAEADLLSALEAYAMSLTEHERPIPYALRDELRLRRLTH
jgi:hypothetical protein